MLTALFVVHAVNVAATAGDEDDDATRLTADAVVSYGLGWDLGKEALFNLGNDGVLADVAAMSLGFRDALSGGEPAHEGRSVQIALISFNDKVFSKHMSERLRSDPVFRALADENQRAGVAFGAKFERLDRVRRGPDGGLFRIDREGTGPSPKPGDRVVLNYHIMLLDGSEVGHGREQEFDSLLMVEGAQRMLPTMHVGERRTILMQPEGATGLAGRGFGIGPGESVLVDVELVGIKDSANE
jgi:FKBP-type peptidyl-prolyl cis-trans isomerase